MRPQRLTPTDEWLSMIHDRLEGIERALNASGSTSSQEPETEEKYLKGVERFECDICGKTFSSERGLKSHKTKAHK